MGAVPAAERRMHRRYPLSTGVDFYHGQSRRRFPGRCIDISAGGMLMYVPAATPLQPGHGLELDLGSIGRSEFTHLSERAVQATVVRVDRQAVLATGHLAVGVRFAQA